MEEGEEATTGSVRARATVVRFDEPPDFLPERNGSKVPLELVGLEDFFRSRTEIPEVPLVSDVFPVRLVHIGRPRPSPLKLEEHIRVDAEGPQVHFLISVTFEEPFQADYLIVARPEQKYMF